MARDLRGRRSAGPLVDDVERAAAAAATGAIVAGVDEVVWEEEEGWFSGFPVGRTGAVLSFGSGLPGTRCCWS